MRRSAGALCSLGLMVCLWAGRANAQVPRQFDFDLERLVLNPSAEGALSVGTGALLPVGAYKLSLATQYEHRPLLLGRTVSGSSTVQTDSEIVAGRMTATLLAAYSFVDWFEMDVAVPVLLHQQGSALEAYDLKAAGLGSIELAPRVGLLSRQKAPVDLAVEIRVRLPWGTADAMARDTGGSLAPAVLAGYSFGGFRLAGEAGVLLRSATKISPTLNDSPDEIGSELRFGGALMQTGRRLRWEGEGWIRLPILKVKQTASGELLAGARYLLTSNLELFGLLGVGIGSAPGIPTFRVLLGGSFGSVVPVRSPRESLTSCDGLPHSLQDCPEFDDDGDGVRNDVDQCPLEPGRADFYGCVKMPDSDADGVLDRDDECPDKPGPIANRGCPIPDMDGDGIRDEIDRCKRQPGLPQFEGCPDSDDDGIPDDVDACPRQKGRADLQGCLPPDLDEDGVPNSLDSCINEAGPADDEHAGCPIPPLVTIGQEDAPGGGAVAQAGPRRKLLKLRQKVYFKTGVSELDPRSLELLDEIAKIIREHLEMKLVEIAAHTDARPTEQEAKRLTDLRADSVRRYLISKGVDAKRLLAKGYGHEKWVASDATAQGREANRRVEFIVVSEEQVSQQGATP